MRRKLINCVLSLASLAFSFDSKANEVPRETYSVSGLEHRAEILIDIWGIPHIYANAHYDAFFVQGFNAARDRLWQIDLWRRRGLGQLSSILGRELLEQDKAARLFLYRGSMFREWLAYGSDAKRIATAFVAGINAYIDLLEQDPALLPIEFRVLGYKPARWQADDVVRIRSNGLWRNVVNEATRARYICKHGLEKQKYLKKLEPPWELVIPEGLDPCDIPEDVTRLYSLAKAPVNFDSRFVTDITQLAAGEALLQGAGSNNWAISGTRTVTGRPILANDPHRGHAVPSLRYVAHLSAPGINVIGAGEPALPGISIGHNERVAFGLTIFSIDQEDMFVYETREKHPAQYRYRAGWEKMREVRETFEIRDEQSIEVTLKFTRHGPVIYEDTQTRKAFAVKAAWLEPGMAPYFGSIEYMRAQNWDEFLAALNRWGAPSENQVYADIDGNIGYKPAGLAPMRSGFDGLLPVPGDGSYEWLGFLDMDQLPVDYNPERGWVATANAMSLPQDYPYAERKLGFEWAAPWRINRIEQVLTASPKTDISDSIALQRDYYSIPAARILPLLPDLADKPEMKIPATLFQDWDMILSTESGAAALFQIWFSLYLGPATMRTLVGEAALKDTYPIDSLVVVEQLELMPPGKRASLLKSSLVDATRRARTLMGDDPEQWHWGTLHRMKFMHPLHNLVDGNLQQLLAMKPVARGGSADTPNSTRYMDSSFDVVSGASWRMVLDVGNWDAAVMTNAPGQSGDPSSKHYDDLLNVWANDGSVPLLFSRKAIESHLEKIIYLIPDQGSQ